MAKRKKKGKRRYYGKKKKGGGPKAKPAGIAGGLALTAADIGWSKTSYGTLGPVPQLFTSEPLGTRIEYVMKALKDTATQPSNYKYALVGVLVSGSKSIPIISMLARPADRGLKRLSKGKWGL